VRKAYADSLARASERTTEDSQADARPLVLFVRSRYFSVASASLIILSTLLIGIETQVLSSLSDKGPGSEQLLHTLSATNYALTFMFAVEVATRMYVLRLVFFLKERIWNFFDIIILLLALAEVALEIVVRAFAGGDRTLFDSGGLARMLRLFRLTRLLRLVRTFRSLKPLRMLVHSIIFAGRSVIWALVLLLMIMYAFGVILTQAVAEHTEGGTRIDDEDLVWYYGDLYRSMLSLWMAVSGGINWKDLSAPLEATGNAHVMLFLLYIAFVYFFVLNVVTGVFCQNAIEGAQQDLDLSIEAHLREKQVYVDHLRLLFEEMNEEDGATIDGLTASALHMQLDRPKVQSWFKALDIDAKKTWKLFKILDASGSGTVSLDAFVEGCLQLKGSASRVDVESLKWEIRSASSRAEHAADRIATLLENIQPSLAARGMD